MRIACDEEDVPFDDHLGDVNVPVLYFGAAGGNGLHASFTTTLLGSADVTVEVVQKLTDAERPFDFGHLDILTGDEARDLVWLPILDWLEAR